MSTRSLDAAANAAAPGAERLSLPPHCEVQALDGQTMPWQLGVPHVPVMAIPAGSIKAMCHHHPVSLIWNDAKLRRANQKRLRIGLTWAAGTKDNAAARRAARLRSMPVELLKDWLNHHPLRKQLEIVNLQHPNHPEHCGEFGEAALKRDGDWCDTAAGAGSTGRRDQRGHRHGSPGWCHGPANADPAQSRL